MRKSRFPFPHRWICSFRQQATTLPLFPVLLASGILLLNAILSLFIAPSDLCRQAHAWALECCPYFLPLLACNLCLLALYHLGKRHIIAPLRYIAEMVQSARAEMAEEAPPPNTRPLSVHAIARELGALLGMIQECHRKHHAMQRAFEEARTAIAEMAQQRDVILHTTNHAMVEQYQAVLAYANYLETLIASQQADASVRYDFDDACESAFNLKLITNALECLQQPLAPQEHWFTLAELMQQTLLALAPSLDRRSMSLTTAEMDLTVAVLGDVRLMNHVVWMLLLGIIRFAADESILRMRCLYSSDRTQAILSLGVSELAPGRLSEAEREAHLERQLQYATPHMFAETIRRHANVQLAEMLLGPVIGSITVSPLTHYSCEICLTLPAAPGA